MLAEPSQVKDDSTKRCENCPSQLDTRQPWKADWPFSGNQEGPSLRPENVRQIGPTCFRYEALSAA